MTSVSIVTPAFNCGLFIERMIDSIQKQTLLDWELIIIDDGSVDDTLQIVTSCIQDDARISCLSLDRNSGPSVARNCGLRAAQGDWIALIDADDICLPTRLQKMLEVADARQLDMVADNQFLYDEMAGTIVRVGFHIQNGSFCDLPMSMLFAKDTPYSRFSLGLIKPLIRREIIRSSGVSYLERFRANEDFLFYAELLAAGAKAGLMAEPLYVYTQQVGQKSQRRSTQSRTRPNLINIISLSDYFVGKYSAMLSRSDLTAVEFRRKAFLRTAEFERWKDDLRGCDPLRTAKAVFLSIRFYRNLALYICRSHARPTKIKAIQ